MSNLDEYSDYLNDEELLEIVQEVSSFDGKAKTILYVEARFDVGCWNQILNNLGVSDYFEVMKYGQTNGKTALLKLLKDDHLHAMQMIAIDADLDRLIGIDKEKFDNPFVFDTIVYSIEGIVYHETVIQKFLQGIEQDYKVKVNYQSFIKQYSAKCYEVLSEVVRYFIEHSLDEQNDLVEQFQVCNLTESIIDSFLEKDNGAIFDLSKCEKGDFICSVLESKGVTPNTAYQYVRGHSLQETIDRLIRRLLNEIISTEFGKAKTALMRKGQTKRINNEMNSIRNDVENKFKLQTYIRNADYSSSDAFLQISQKINKTVQDHLI